MFKISVKTSSDEWIEAKEYLERARLTNSIVKLQFESMLFDLHHNFRNDLFIVAEIGYKFKPSSCYTIEDAIAELVVLREELDEGTFYSYWIGTPRSLQLIRRFPEYKGV